MKRFNPHPLAMRTVVIVVMLGALAGCQTLTDSLQSDRVDYQATSSAPPLVVPPGLSQVPVDQKYVAPPKSAVLGPPAPVLSTPTAAGNKTLGVPSAQDPLGMHIESDGDHRWLVVDGRTPNQLWSQIHDFWEANGFTIVTDSPDTGVMETDWAENRAKIGEDWFRRLFGKFVSGLYSSGTRDQFRTLIEPGSDGSTDVFITHRGMEEVLIGAEQSTSRWESRPRDPKLEDAFLERLMEKFGLTTAQATQLLVNAQSVPDRASIIDSASGTPKIDLAEPFDRAWLRVGLALDRTNFTVDNSDRTKGIYTVRYSDPVQQVKQEGLLGKLFSGHGKSQSREFRINVRPVGDTATQVAVLDDNGQVDTSPDAQKLVTALHAQLN